MQRRELLAEVRRMTADWVQRYGHERRHSALGYLTDPQTLMTSAGTAGELWRVG